MIYQGQCEITTVVYFEVEADTIDEARCKAQKEDFVEIDWGRIGKYHNFDIKRKCGELTFY